MSTIRVLIVEDEDLFRQMMHQQLASYPDIDVVGEASSGQEAIELAKALEPEVVLMDIELRAEPNGIQAGKTIKESAPATGIVLLSMHDDKLYVESALGENPSGWSYLLKKNIRDANAVARAIKGASWGIVMVDSELLGKLRPRADTPLSKLTKDQLAMLD